MKPITSGHYPLPARRPRHPVTRTDKIKRVFGVEMPHWEDHLRVFRSTLAAVGHRAHRFELEQRQHRNRRRRGNEGRGSC